MTKKTSANAGSNSSLEVATGLENQRNTINKEKESQYGGAFGTSFKLFGVLKADPLVTAERLRELKNSLIGVVSILKNPPENKWQLVL